MSVTQQVSPNSQPVQTTRLTPWRQDFLLQSGFLGSLLTYPAIAGHEGAGIIRAIGSAVKDKSLSLGDAVLLSFQSCGTCDSCTSKNVSKCPLFHVLNLAATRWPEGTSPATMAADGRPVGSQFFGQSSFARFSAVHERCVVKCAFPEDLAIYAPMGCGYQTGAGTVLNILKPKPHHTVAVFGVGSVGFAAVMAAAAVGVKELIAVDVVEGKLELAKALGATHAINSSKTEKGVVEEVKALTGGKGVDFAIDATGIPAVVGQMLDSLALAGTAASVGAPPPGQTIPIDVGMFFAGAKTWLTVIEGDAYPPEVVSPNLPLKYGY